MSGEDEILDGLWYVAALSREVKKGAMVRRILFGDPVVLGRTKAGDLFALRDVCPHRASPLSPGRIIDGEDGAAVECPYHAWRFRASDGKCAGAPALASSAGQDPGSIAVPAFMVHEANGLIWIYKGEGEQETPPPALGLPEDFRPRTATIVEGEGPFDEAVIGLVDPAHTPVVHKQWWWRDTAPRKDKVKHFEPTALGFKMPAHPPSSNSMVYKFLGGAPTTEIEFRLPSLRFENIRVGKRRVLSFTAMTPGEAGKTRITHVIYWDLPLLSLLRPVAQGMADSFLEQDGAILRLQNENLKRMDHRPLYLGDPDEPAKMYMRLKRAWARRREEGFSSPIRPVSFEWRT